jgi:hypothetical protein
LPFFLDYFAAELITVTSTNAAVDNDD